MVLVPPAEAVAAAAIAPFKALAFTEAAKLTTAVLALAAVAALVAAATLALAAFAAAVTAAETAPAFVGVAALALVALAFLLDSLEDSEAAGDAVAPEVLLVLVALLELLELEPFPVDEPLLEDVEPVLVVLVFVLEFEPVPVVPEDPFALTGPAMTIPLASIVTPPVLPPVDDTEPLTLIAWAVAVI